MAVSEFDFEGLEALTSKKLMKAYPTLSLLVYDTMEGSDNTYLQTLWKSDYISTDIYKSFHQVYVPIRKYKKLYSPRLVSSMYSFKVC